MEALPGYDRWKLVAPPEPEERCKHCGKTFECHDEYNEIESHDFEVDPNDDGGDELYDQAQDDAQ